jgi:putative heme iron utilization protein
MTETGSAPPLQPEARAARDVMRDTGQATLATSRAGWPFASLVLVALDQDGTPLLLMSDLAEHVKNIKSDERVSLLFDGTAGLDDPLTGPRVTVLGEARRDDDIRLRQRFIGQHPSAELYASFADFHLYRVAVTRAHFVAGFGRIHWIEGQDLLGSAPPSVSGNIPPEPEPA